MKILQAILLLQLLCRGYTVYGTRICLRGDFDTQVQCLLSQEILSSEEIQRLTSKFDQLQDTLRRRWEDAELLPFGSFLSGLATKTSDIDFSVHVPDYNNTADAYLVEETAKILYEKPEQYLNITVKLGGRVPHVQMYDVALQKNIDISFNKNGVYKTNAIAYYLNLDKRFVPLTGIIKLWCKVNNLTGHDRMPNYAVYLMVIFYLQQKRMSPTGEQIQTHATPRLVNNWNLNFEPVPYTLHNNETLYHLLGGFFKYYSEFDYAEYCVSTFVGRPVARRLLRDINKVPHEFTAYKSYLKAGNKPIELDRHVCIQDIYEHKDNVVVALEENVLKFLNHVKFAARMYDYVPENLFLESILFTQQNSRS